MVSFLFKNIYRTYVAVDKEKNLIKEYTICFHSFDKYVFFLSD